MWSRLFEVFLAIWLALSPFIFKHPPEEAFLWANDFVSASFILLFALLSFWKPLDKVHLLNLLVGAWLIAAAFLLVPPPPPAGFQNYVVVGLLLMMFAILPSRSEQLPFSWQQFFEKRVEKCE